MITISSSQHLLSFLKDNNATLSPDLNRSLLVGYDNNHISILEDKIKGLISFITNVTNLLGLSVKSVLLTKLKDILSSLKPTSVE